MLRITETFVSLQGEASDVGRPTLFIRLTGCPLRCQYCDTAYAFTGGEPAELSALTEQARRSGVQHVCVTGGEPLAQRECPDLLRMLCDEGFSVSLETSGAMDIAAVDPRVRRVVDIKTPASGECARNRIENFALLTAADEIKFVICDRADYDWACDFIREHELERRCDILMSPSWQQLEASNLADWIIEDRLPVRFQVQLHKLLWGDVAGR